MSLVNTYNYLTQGRRLKFLINYCYVFNQIILDTAGIGIDIVYKEPLDDSPIAVDLKINRIFYSLSCSDNYVFNLMST